MARKPVLVQLTEDLDAQLDRLATAEGRSKSALVRDAVAEYATRRSVELKEHQMLAGYTAIPDDDEFDAIADANVEAMVSEEPW